jgi:hypothetical protein
MLPIKLGIDMSAVVVNPPMLCNELHLPHTNCERRPAVAIGLRRLADRSDLWAIREHETLSLLGCIVHQPVPQIQAANCIIHVLQQGPVRVWIEGGARIWKGVCPWSGALLGKGIRAMRRSCLSPTHRRTLHHRRCNSSTAAIWPLKSGVVNRRNSDTRR